MGVHGFYSYLKKHYPSVGSRIQSNADQSINLIFDGNSFVHFVVSAMPIDTPIHDQLKHLLRFTHAFQQCHVEPFFIFDGISPKEKHAERLKRNHSKLYDIEQSVQFMQSASSSCPKMGNILSLFTLPAAIDLLQKLQIPVIMAEAEADLVLASFARDKNAFIVSNDSDFFFLESPGFIPLDTLDIDLENPTEFKGFCYHRDKIAQTFGIHPHLMGLLAARIGCDYSNPLPKGVPIKTHIQSCIRKIKNEKRSCHEIEQNARILYAASKYDSSQESRTAAHLNHHPKLSELSHQHVFYRSPLLQDLNQSCVWNLSQRIRQLWYGYAINQENTITEYGRKGKAHQTFEVQPLEAPASFDSLFHLNFNLETKMEFLKMPIVACRWLIEECDRIGSKIADYELMAFVCALSLSLQDHSIAFSPPSRKSIHRYGQFESILFTIYLTDQAYRHSSNYAHYWSHLNPRLYYKCMEMAKGGSRPERIMASLKGDLEAYRQVLACFADKFTQVDQIFEYLDMNQT